MKLITSVFMLFYALNLHASLDPIFLDLTKINQEDLDASAATREVQRKSLLTERVTIVNGLLSFLENLKNSNVTEEDEKTIKSELDKLNVIVKKMNYHDALCFAHITLQEGLKANYAIFIGSSDALLALHNFLKIESDDANRVKNFIGTHSQTIFNENFADTSYIHKTDEMKQANYEETLKFLDKILGSNSIFSKPSHQRRKVAPSIHSFSYEEYEIGISDYLKLFVDYYGSTTEDGKNFIHKNFLPLTTTGSSAKADGSSAKADRLYAPVVNTQLFIPLNIDSSDLEDCQKIQEILLKI